MPASRSTALCTSFPACLSVLLLLALFGGAQNLTAQIGLQPGSQTGGGYDPLAASHASAPNAITQPTLSPDLIHLMELEGVFAKEVAAGGGKAFAKWFADDAIILNNGRPAIIGREAIAAQANWDPKVYQLSWIPQGGQMGPSNDMGFTWGHYEGRSTDRNGQPVITSGRYMTVWKRLPDGQWKVALDASADDASADCCALPKP